MLAVVSGVSTGFVDRKMWIREIFCYADLYLSSKSPVVACEPVAMTTTI